MDEPFRIDRRAMRKIARFARAADPNECMGLLVARSGDAPGRARMARLLPAKASRAYAEAAPLDIGRVVRELRSRSLKLVGLWHSHGRLGVHHSSIDDETVARLLPGMAEENFQRPRPEPA